MAARRVVTVSSKNNGISRPTCKDTPFDIKVENPTLSNLRKRPIFAAFIKPVHKRASRMLGYALTLGSEAAWRQFCFVINVRLSPAERAALAFAALSSLDEDHAQQTAEAALWGIVKDAAA